MSAEGTPSSVVRRLTIGILHCVVLVLLGGVQLSSAHPTPVVPLCDAFVGSRSHTLSSWDQPTLAEVQERLAARASTGSTGGEDVDPAGDVNVTLGQHNMLPRGGVVRGCDDRLHIHCRLRDVSPTAKWRDSIHFYAPCPTCPPLTIPARYRDLVTSSGATKESHQAGPLAVLLGLPEAQYQAPLRATSRAITSEFSGASDVQPPVSAPAASDFVRLLRPDTRESTRNRWVWWATRLFPMQPVAEYAYALGDTLLDARALLGRYAWYSPAAIERLFFRRVVRMEYTLWEKTVSQHVTADGRLVNVEDEAEHTARMEPSIPASRPKPSRATLMSFGSLRTLRLVSYLPSATPKPHGGEGQNDDHRHPPGDVLTCNFKKVLDARAQWSDALKNLEEAHVLLDSTRHSADVDDDRADEDDGGIPGYATPRSLEEFDLDLPSSYRGGGEQNAWVGRAEPLSLTRRLLGRLAAVPEWLVASGRVVGGLRGNPVSRSGSASPPVLSAVLLHSFPTLRAARMALDTVHEYLGPWQSVASPLVPEWWYVLTGARLLHAEQRLVAVRHEVVLEEASAAYHRLAPKASMQKHRVVRQQEVFVFEASLPAAQAVCLAVLPVAPSSAEGSPAFSRTPPVTITETMRVDWVWLCLFAVCVLLYLVQRYAQANPLVQGCMAAVYSLFLVAVLLTLYALKEIQRMTVGKLGVVVIVAVGGFTALTEALLSLLAYAAQQQQLHDTVLPYLVFGVVAFGTVSAVVMRVFVPVSYLQRGTSWGLSLMLGLTFAAAFRWNPEATLLATLFCATMRPSLVVKGILWASGGNKLEAVNADKPRDDLPASARQEVGYTRPLAVEGLRYGATLARGGVWGDEDTVRTAKMRQYARDGAVHTRQALESLAAHIRADPGRYAHRLRDANAVQLWAGSQHLSEEEDDDFSGSDGDM